MDDLKIFGKIGAEQQGLLTIVKGFSGDIKMEFGLEKCAKTTLKRGKPIHAENIEFDLDTTIQDLKQEDGHLQIPRHKQKRQNRAWKHERKIRKYYMRKRLVLKV